MQSLITNHLLSNFIFLGQNGSLLQSLDSGDNWNDITTSLPFSFGHFKELTFAASTVYVATDTGGMNSRDGETWHALTDADENLLIMDCIAVDATKVYGVCEKGIYRIDNETGTWQQLTSEVPYNATALAVDGNMFYIGTNDRGVLRLQPNAL